MVRLDMLFSYKEEIHRLHRTSREGKTMSSLNLPLQTTKIGYDLALLTCPLAYIYASVTGGTLRQ